MQKSMRYHIADGENQPVVRAVALVVQRATEDADLPAERPQTERPAEEKSVSRANWFRPVLRKAHLRSS